MRRGHRPALWPLMVAMAVLGFSAILLVWLRGRLVNAEAEFLIGAVDLALELELIGDRAEPSADFGLLAAYAASVKRGQVLEVRLCKMMPDGREVCLVPFHLDSTEPSWRNSRDWIRLPIGEDGVLYADPDRRPLMVVNAALVLYGLALATVLGLLLARVRGQELVAGRLADELERRRREVIRLERLALVGQLSANILHDLRKPILNIKGEVEDLLDDPAHGAFKGPGKAILGQADLFLSILGDTNVEAFASGSWGEEWCDLEEMVARSARLVGREISRVKLSVYREPGGDCLVLAEPHRLVQVFSNLLLNASQAMPSGGEISVMIRKDFLDYEILFEDNGPGIPADLKASVFEPFVSGRRSEGGTGLGLYICKSICSELGGSIRLGESGLGGACFVVSLPTGDQRVSRGES